MAYLCAVPSPHVAICTLRGRHCAHLYHYLLFTINYNNSSKTILIYFYSTARSMGYDFIFLGCSFGLAPNRGFLVCLGQKSVGYTNTYKETGVL